MKITYGSRIAGDGKTTFNVSHKWAKWSVEEMAVMVMRRVFQAYPDADSFEWFARDGKICAGRCKLGTNS